MIAALAGAVHYFPVVKWIVDMQKRIGQMEWYGALLYPLFLAACNLLLLPAGVLSIGSGLFFGLWWGFFLVWSGTVLGAAVAFGISRALGRQWVEKRLFKNRKLAALDEAISREGWKIILLSQLHPLFPTSLINYLYGVTRMKFWDCMLWVAIGQAPGLFLYSYFGTLAQYGIRLMQHKTHPRPIEYVVWIGGLLLTFGVTFALGRIALRLLREVEAKARAANPLQMAKPEGQATAEADSAAMHAKF